VFIGPMAAGKTKTGKRVARLLEVGFTDTDKAIVAEHGPVSEIFDTRGEAHFRALERDAVVRALASDDVVALGGGAVLDLDTRADLAGHRVVYLHATPEAIEARIDPDTRPLIRSGIAEWERIFAARRPIYEALAHLTIDTSHGDFDDVAEEVIAWLRS
jgi:shikimate kinase